VDDIVSHLEENGLESVITVGYDLPSSQLGVDIAKKYGGGGHLLACGCTIYNKDDIDNIINDFNSLLKG
jgi:hypothetical protein